jgi:hypothetical protein
VATLIDRNGRRWPVAEVVFQRSGGRVSFAAPRGVTAGTAGVLTAWDGTREVSPVHVHVEMIDATEDPGRVLVTALVNPARDSGPQGKPRSAGEPGPPLAAGE